MSVLDGVFNNTYGLKQSELDEINKSFQEFDRDNNGYISRDELKHCLKCSNIFALDAIVDTVLKQMDWNRDGRVSYQEYLQFMVPIYRGENKDLKRQLASAGDFVGSSTDGL